MCSKITHACNVKQKDGAPFIAGAFKNKMKDVFSLGKIHLQNNWESLNITSDYSYGLSLYSENLQHYNNNMLMNTYT